MGNHRQFPRTTLAQTAAAALMARICSVIATSHSPFLFKPQEWWNSVRDARPRTADNPVDTDQDNADKLAAHTRADEPTCATSFNAPNPTSPWSSATIRKSSSDSPIFRRLRCMRAEISRATVNSPMPAYPGAGNSCREARETWVEGAHPSRPCARTARGAAAFGFRSRVHAGLAERDARNGSRLHAPRGQFDRRPIRRPRRCR